MSAIMPTYARSELAFERGDGSFLFTSDGTAYLDYATGIAVNALGHNHPALVEALKSQADKLWHVSNLYTIPEGERLAQRFTERCAADKVFFCNSGAEALEGAFKTARKYQSAVGQPKRYRIISLTGAFHGRTLATISATKNPKHLAGFGPEVDGFDQVPMGNMNVLRQAITEETAGIVIEPVQGEGGITAADAEFMRDVRQVCDEFGLMMIVDEVQCGMGRTGKLFGYMWSDIEPDIIATAKGIGGGFPFGAFMATEKAAQGMVAGTHGSTYGGNPLAMAVGNAVLDYVGDEAFLAQVRDKAERLGGLLYQLQAKHAIITDVRGIGLIRGLKLADSLPAADVVAALRDQHILTVPAGDNVVRVLPPLTTSIEEMQQFCAGFDRVLNDLA